jgi:hypothetical protein
MIYSRLCCEDGGNGSFRTDLDKSLSSVVFRVGLFATYSDSENQTTGKERLP